MRKSSSITEKQRCTIDPTGVPFDKLLAGGGAEPAAVDWRHAAPLQGLYASPANRYRPDHCRRN
jgi:hypothetical protein